MRVLLVIVGVVLAGCAAPEAPAPEMAEPVIVEPVAPETGLRTETCDPMVVGDGDGIGGTGCPPLVE